MTATDDRQFPAPLAAALAVEFDYDGGEGIDFEPFSQFESQEETTDWIRSWTGNQALTGNDFRIFGQDGSGGYATVWLVRPGQALPDQPVVFLGSEGESGVLARNLGDFLWLLAGGFGPAEALLQGDEWVGRPNPELTAIAERFAPEATREPLVVLAQAGQEFPDFTATLDALCR
ncbi:MAG TPA: hypothetical protein VLJ88_05565 [Propionibacteriaceae bacterium]|nr:hypothetical protein [Propionibacteriaceae bacterium]